MLLGGSKVAALMTPIESGGGSPPERLQRSQLRVNTALYVCWATNCCDLSRGRTFDLVVTGSSCKHCISERDIVEAGERKLNGVQEPQSQVLDLIAAHCVIVCVCVCVCKEVCICV